MSPPTGCLVGGVLLSRKILPESEPTTRVQIPILPSDCRLLPDKSTTYEAGTTCAFVLREGDGRFQVRPSCEAALEIIGVLLERSPGLIVLCNGTRVLLREGMTADHIPIGRSVTISYTVESGVKIADDIRLNADWLLEAIEATGAF